MIYLHVQYGERQRSRDVRRVVFFFLIVWMCKIGMTHSDEAAPSPTRAPTGWLLINPNVVAAAAAAAATSACNNSARLQRQRLLRQSTSALMLLDWPLGAWANPATTVVVLGAMLLPDQVVACSEARQR